MGDGGNEGCEDGYPKGGRRALGDLPSISQCAMIQRNTDILTIMLKNFALITALPEYATLVGTHHFPRAEINDTLVGGVLEKYSERNRRSEADQKQQAKHGFHLVSKKGDRGDAHGRLVARRTEVKCRCLCGRTLGSWRRQGRNARGWCPG